MDSTDLDLIAELRRRLTCSGFAPSLPTLRALDDLRVQLGSALDVHENRFSAARLRDQLQVFYHDLADLRPDLAGATVLDAGCGEHNPLAMLFVFLLLGAQRGIAIDAAPLVSETRMALALAEVATCMLLDPHRLVGDVAPAATEWLQNIASFDLAALARGDVRGIDASRLRFHQTSITELPIDDNAVDFVYSNAFLEHVDDLDRALAELARVTRPGSLSVHSIDFSDHRRYEGLVDSPLAFLSVPGEAAIVHDCNRVRPLEYVPLFERHGFRILRTRVIEHYELPSAEHATFVEPFRSMPPEDLQPLVVHVTLGRRS